MAQGDETHKSKVNPPDSEQQRIPLRIGTAIGPGSLSLPIHARNRQEQHPAQRVTGLDSLDIENI